MSLVLDANILVKLVIAEPGSERVRTSITSYLRNGYSLHSLDLGLAESLNALWKHVKIHEDVKTEDARSAVHDLTRIYDGLNILATRDLSKEALDLAFTQNITVYDALYIAAARKLKATLYTADETLYDASKDMITSELVRP